MLDQFVSRLKILINFIRRKAFLYRNILNNQSRKVEPYAFIRVFNEEYTLLTSLNSITPAIKKGIIAYHDPLPGIEVDNTVSILENWVKEHPGFKLVKYPHFVIPPTQILHRFIKIAPEWYLDKYYEFALQELKNHAIANGDYESAFVVKIDCDQVYSSQALIDFFNFIRYDKTQYSTYFLYSLDVHFVNQRVTMRPNSFSHYDHYCIKLSEFPSFYFKTNELSFSSLEYPIKIIIPDSSGLSNSKIFRSYSLTSYYRYVFTYRVMLSPWWDKWSFPLKLPNDKVFTEPYLFRIINQYSWFDNIYSYESVKIDTLNANFLAFITSVHLRFNKYEHITPDKYNYFRDLKSEINNLLKSTMSKHTFNYSREWFTEKNLYINVFNKLSPKALAKFKTLKTNIDTDKLMKISRNYYKQK